MVSKSVTEKKQTTGTAVPAVSVLLGSMHNAKRSGSVAKSNLNNDLKKACSASKAAMLTGLEEPSAKRFMPSSPAIITTAPVVFVLTLLSMAGYWRQVPSVPLAVREFVDVQQASPGVAPPPPTLPKSVPFHIRGPVDVAVRAAKQAWLIETKRADILGKEVSDEHLNNLYRRGRQWYARHADRSDVRPPRNSLTLGFPRAMRAHVIRTCLMLRR